MAFRNPSNRMLVNEAALTTGIACTPRWPCFLKKVRP
jgi:hypothetical protein